MRNWDGGEIFPLDPCGKRAHPIGDARHMQSGVVVDRAANSEEKEEFV